MARCVSDCTRSKTKHFSKDNIVNNFELNNGTSNVNETVADFGMHHSGKFDTTNDNHDGSKILCEAILLHVNFLWCYEILWWCLKMEKLLLQINIVLLCNFLNHVKICGFDSDFKPSLVMIFVLNVRCYRHRAPNALLISLQLARCRCVETTREKQRLCNIWMQQINVPFLVSTCWVDSGKL